MGSQLYLTYSFASNLLPIKNEGYFNSPPIHTSQPLFVMLLCYDKSRGDEKTKQYNDDWWEWSVNSIYPIKLSSSNQQGNHCLFINPKLMWGAKKNNT